MTELKLLVVSILSVVAVFHHHLKYPTYWLRQEECIHQHESTDWHKKTTWNGYPSNQRGGLQILISTWQAFAPSRFPRYPDQATKAQQIFVGWLIYVANGRVWGTGRIGIQWPNSSRECGVR